MSKKPYKTLTARQELLCQNISQGMSQRDAMVKAGFKDSPNVNQNCTTQMKNKLIQDRIEELKSKSISASIATLSDCKEKLTEIMNDDDTGRAIVIKAINELSKLSSWETQKIDINITKDVSELSDEDLMGLL
jgi:hypothetical protein